MTQPSAEGSGNSPRTTYVGHPDMRQKKQVTARITDQFAKDLNLVMACTKTDNATHVVQDAVHQLAEYYRYVVQKRMAAMQEGSTDE